MHPIERLRYVARADSVPDRYLIPETMGGLFGFFGDSASLLIALRAMLSRQPESVGLIVMAARLLTALDVDDAAHELAAQLEADRTQELADEVSVHEAAGCVVIDSIGSGPNGVLCPDGTNAMLAHAKEAGRTSAIVTPFASRLPGGLWTSYLTRTETRRGEMFGGELHAWSDFDEVIGPEGPQPLGTWVPDCQEAPEINRW